MAVYPDSIVDKFVVDDGHVANPVSGFQVRGVYPSYFVASVCGETCCGDHVAFGVPGTRPLSITGGFKAGDGHYVGGTGVQFGTPNVFNSLVVDFVGVPLSGAMPLSVAFTDLTSYPPPAGPSSTLLVSYTPGTDRNDFDGAVGVRLGIGGATIPITWLGLRCNGYGGTRTVKIYEWFSGAVQATVTIDYTGKAVGEYAWTQFATFNLLANGYYAILMDVHASDGMIWKNPGPVSYQPSIVNVYDSYLYGGLQTGSQNSSFVGIDLG